jgi:hypothetical protein
MITEALPAAGAEADGVALDDAAGPDEEEKSLLQPCREVSAASRAKSGGSLGRIGLGL